MTPPSAVTFLILQTGVAYNPTLLSKLSHANGIQGQPHTWLPDILYSRNQRVALNRNLSPPLSVMAEVPRYSVLESVLFLIFINDLSHSLENPFINLLMTPSFAVTSLILHIGGLWPLPSFQTLIKSQADQKHFEYVFQS